MEPQTKAPIFPTAHPPHTPSRKMRSALTKTRIFSKVVRLDLSGYMHLDFQVESVRQGFTSGFEIVPRLEVHPQLCSGCDVVLMRFPLTA